MTALLLPEPQPAMGEHIASENTAASLLRAESTATFGSIRVGRYLDQIKRWKYAADESSSPNAPRKIGSTDGPTAVAQKSADIISFPEYKPVPGAPSEFMWALKEWDGHVTELTDESLIALISAIHSDGSETERLEYPLDALTEAERAQVRVGSIFRLSCGYLRQRKGTRIHTMVMYFRKKSVYAQTDSVAAGEIIREMFSDTE